MEQLVSQNLQNDQRFIEDFVRSRTLRGNGPLRISQELRMRGVDDGLFQHWLDEQAIDWLHIASNTFAKKFGSREASDARERAKRMRYMQSKGFPGDIIRQIIR